MQTFLLFELEVQLFCLSIAADSDRPAGFDARPDAHQSLRDSLCGDKGANGLVLFGFAAVSLLGR